MNTKVTDEQISHAGLSEEEIAALEEEDSEGTGEESSTAAADDSDGGGGEADSKPDDLPQASDDEPAAAAADPKDTPAEDEKPADEKPAADAKPADEGTPAADAKTDETPADEPAPPPVVDSFRQQLLARGIPEDFEEQLTATNDAIEALDKKLEDGEIEYAAHAKENRTLTTKLSELTANKREAEFVSANNEVSADQHWSWEVERFIEENDEFKNPVIYGALRGALDEMYKVDENQGKPYRWFLREAAGQVREAFNITKPVDEGKPDDEKKAEAIEKEIEDKPQGAPPKTLADVPAAAEDEETSDQFSAIDKLEGMDLEAALSKLPKAEADKYLDSRNY